jgi:hypothetical protein
MGVTKVAGGSILVNKVKNKEKGPGLLYLLAPYAVKNPIITERTVDAPTTSKLLMKGSVTGSTSAVAPIIPTICLGSKIRMKFMKVGSFGKKYATLHSGYDLKASVTIHKTGIRIHDRKIIITRYLVNLLIIL